jgi:hypothetical protein
VNPRRLLSLPIEPITAALTGNYATRGRLEDADCVIGFSFGYRGKPGRVAPGLSNHDLAELAIRQLSDLPKILQFEIADAYAAASGPTAAPVQRITKHRQPAKYLDTHEVAEQAQQLMRRYGYTTAVLLAHPYHLPRVQLVCDRLKLRWVTLPDMRGAVEFDPQSAQTWTRNLDRWRGYEPLAMLYYRMKGWV